MKGVSNSSWAPAPIVALTIVPIVILALVTYIAIKCTTWAPALKTKLQTWVNQTWANPSCILGRKRKASDPTEEEPKRSLSRARESPQKQGLDHLFV